MSQLVTVVPYQRSVRPDLSLRDDREIQVSGGLCFPENRWREAILYYLFGVWGNKERVMYRPKIVFGCVGLYLNTDNDTYHVRSATTDSPLLLCQKEEELVVGYRQIEVEQGLIRFVKNNAIKVLTLNLGSAVVQLCKGRTRGRYDIWAHS